MVQHVLLSRSRRRSRRRRAVLAAGARVRRHARPRAVAPTPRVRGRRPAHPAVGCSGSAVALVAHVAARRALAPPRRSTTPRCATTRCTRLEHVCFVAHRRRVLVDGARRRPSVATRRSACSRSSWPRCPPPRSGLLMTLAAHALVPGLPARLARRVAAGPAGRRRRHVGLRRRRRAGRSARRSSSRGSRASTAPTGSRHGASGPGTVARVGARGDPAARSAGSTNGSASSRFTRESAQQGVPGPLVVHARRDRALLLRHPGPHRHRTSRFFFDPSVRPVVYHGSYAPLDGVAHVGGVRVDHPPQLRRPRRARRCARSTTGRRCCSSPRSWPTCAASSSPARSASHARSTGSSA